VYAPKAALDDNFLSTELLVIHLLFMVSTHDSRMEHRISTAKTSRRFFPSIMPPSYSTTRIGSLILIICTLTTTRLHYHLQQVDDGKALGPPKTARDSLRNEFVKPTRDRDIAFLDPFAKKLEGLNAEETEEEKEVTTTEQVKTSEQKRKISWRKPVPTKTLPSVKIRKFVIDPPTPYKVSDDFRIAIIRAIGNALPPRHDANQTLRSLRFTLENEVRHPNVVRHWLLNRIVDPVVEADVISLLQQHGENYTVEPFVFKDYGRIRYKRPLMAGATDRFHFTIMTRKGKKLKLPPNKAPPDRAKRVYAMNVNGARNQMLDIGLNMEIDPDWILPLDGNCFFTKSAMDDLVSHLQYLNVLKEGESVSKKYAYIPMLRLKGDNEELLTEKFRQVNATEEEQIAFHRTAQERFHPGLWYGKANKVEFLLRLGVSDKIHLLPPKEMVVGGPLNAPIAELGPSTKVSAASWVARLQSGNADAEDDNAQRWIQREDSITRFFGGLEDRMLSEGFGYTPEKLLYFDEDVLENERIRYVEDDAHLSTLIEQLQDYGDEILNQTFLEDIGSPLVQCDLMHGVHKQITILTLAHYFTQNDDYAEYASAIVNTWFVNKTTAMTPKTDYACALGTMNGIAHVLDAVRLLHKSGHLLMDDVVPWMESYRGWLEDGNDGMKLFTSKSRFGTMYDVQAVTLAAFLGDEKGIRWYLEYAPRRFQPQVRSDNYFADSMEGAKCEEARVAELQAWQTLARMAGKLGFMLWRERFIGNSYSVLCTTSRNIIPQLKERAQCKLNEVPVESQRWWPLYHDARRHCPHLMSVQVPSGLPNGWSDVPPEDIHQLPPTFKRSLGLAPFWNLGYTADP